MHIYDFNFGTMTDTDMSLLRLNNVITYILNHGGRAKTRNESLFYQERNDRTLRQPDLNKASINLRICSTSVCFHTFHTFINIWERCFRSKNKYKIFLSLQY